MRDPKAFHCALCQDKLQRYSAGCVQTYLTFIAPGHNGLSYCFIDVVNDSIFIFSFSMHL